MLLADDRFAENGGGDGDLVSSTNLQQRLVLQAEAVNFDIGENDGLPGCVDHGRGFGQGFGEGLRVAGLVDARGVR